jgi:dCTP deaminase
VILSNVEIHRALDAGDIVISPEPKRFATIDDPTTAYDTSSVNLTLGPELSIPDRKAPVAFDLRKGGLAGFLAKHCEHKQIDPDGGFNLQPGMFLLARTIERVAFPIREGHPVFAARVEGRSSLARCGMLVHFTAPTIHAGFEGTITLEIINLGPYPVSLYRSMKVCQLIIEQVHGIPSESPSQFQGQGTPAGTKSKS